MAQFSAPAHIFASLQCDFAASTIERWKLLPHPLSLRQLVICFDQ